MEETKYTWRDLYEFTDEISEEYRNKTSEILDKIFDLPIFEANLPIILEDIKNYYGDGHKIPIKLSDTNVAKAPLIRDENSNILPKELWLPNDPESNNVTMICLHKNGDFRETDFTQTLIHEIIGHHLTKNLEENYAVEVTNIALKQYNERYGTNYQERFGYGFLEKIEKHEGNITSIELGIEEDYIDYARKLVKLLKDKHLSPEDAKEIMQAVPKGVEVTLSLEEQSLSANFPSQLSETSFSEKLTWGKGGFYVE